MKVPAVVGVPVIAPVEALSVKPPGSPEADQVTPEILAVSVSL